VLEFSHGTGCAVIGGYVYRGCRMDAWQGRYFYGDFCPGFVKTFTMSGGIPSAQADVTAQVDPGGLLGATSEASARTLRGSCTSCRWVERS
jgi:hypothetical protein